LGDNRHHHPTITVMKLGTDEIINDTPKEFIRPPTPFQDPK